MSRIESWRDIPTALGVFRIALDASGAMLSGWHHVGQYPQGGLQDTGLRDDLVEWVQALTSGDPRPVPAFKLPPGPEFFHQCWEACQTLEPGQLLTYSVLAARAGRPTAARAAGAAMRHNPTPLLVPCHRIVRASGELGGFAGRTGPGEPALHLKQKLLELEGCGPNTSSRRGILCLC